MAEEQQPELEQTGTRKRSVSRRRGRRGGRRRGARPAHSLAPSPAPEDAVAPPETGEKMPETPPIETTPENPPVERPPTHRQPARELPKDSRSAVAKAVDDVRRIVDSLELALEQMEEVLALVELAEEQKLGDEREIENLRRALRRFHAPRGEPMRERREQPRREESRRDEPREPQYEEPVREESDEPGAGS